MQTIGDRISIVMQDAGINQTDLAKRLGTNPSSVSSWVSGRYNPSSQTITQICEAFGVNPEWLKDGIGDKDGRSPLSKEASNYLGHAVTHNSTEKDALLRAIANADSATIAEVCRFIVSAAAELKARSTKPYKPDE